MVETEILSVFDRIMFGKNGARNRTGGGAAIHAEKREKSEEMRGFCPKGIWFFSEDSLQENVGKTGKNVFGGHE